MSDVGSSAFVTGASRGIGRAVVELLVSRGRTVVACARDAAALQQLERAHPGRVHGLPVDLTVRGAGVRALDEAERRHGPVSELVLAAGAVQYAALGAIDEQSLRDQLELNFVASFSMLQHAGVQMRARGQGAMVVIASTLARRPAPLTAAYAATKAALVSAAQSCALELAPTVRVNVIAPGVVDTSMVRALRRPLGAGESASEVIAAQLEQLRSLHPLARLGAPLDIAQAALYLLDAPWVTGTVLTVDGGLSLA
ncbi:MAG: 3-oxoacyl-[acyl-carrier protein] reductase [Myxococcaceae bacterium]|nr:3-oxoacyl-[acyl-carrier protein] reductase [Myxococcaceae bacterium]